MCLLSPRRRGTGQSGFSLIELLVVLFIVGMGIGLVTISVGFDNSDLRLEAKQFANQTALVAAEAVLSGEQLGVDIYKDTVDIGDREADVYAYRWLQRVYWTPPPDSDAKPKWLWLPVAIKELESEITFSPLLALQLDIEGVERFIDNKIIVEKNPEQQKEAIKPDIYLLANGEISPFKLQLVSTTDEQVLHTITGDLLGRIRLDEQDEAQ